MTGKGIFTREIDEALLEGRIDLARPQPEGRAVRASRGARPRRRCPPREDPSDVLDLAQPGAASSRRLPPELADRDGEPPAPGAAPRRASGPGRVDARGNVDTRLRRLAEGRWDAIVLARAGLARLGRLDEVREIFDRTGCFRRSGRERSPSSRGRRTTASLRDARGARRSRAFASGGGGREGVPRRTSRRAAGRRWRASRATGGRLDADGGRASRRTARGRSERKRRGPPERPGELGRRVGRAPPRARGRGAHRGGPRGT